jgi:hypothetical protein
MGARRVLLPTLPSPGRTRTPRRHTTRRRDAPRTPGPGHLGGPSGPTERRTHSGVIAPATLVTEANRAHRRALGPTDERYPGPSGTRTSTAPGDCAAGRLRRRRQHAARQPSRQSRGASPQEVVAFGPQPREPSTRGRRELAAWSLSRIGRVSSSGSRPCGAVQPLPARAAGSSVRTPGTRGMAGASVPARRSACGRVATGDTPDTAGNRPVSAVRCRPGWAGARWRPDAPAGAAATGTPSGARRRPTDGDSAVSGARRRPPDGRSPVSGARRRPIDANWAVSSAVRRPPPRDGRSRTTERSRTMGSPVVTEPSPSTERARRPDGWRATDISCVAGA